MKNQQPPRIEPGPLTLVVSALPRELHVWPPGIYTPYVGYIHVHVYNPHRGVHVHVYLNNGRVCIMYMYVSMESHRGECCITTVLSTVMFCHCSVCSHKGFTRACICMYTYERMHIHTYTLIVVL